MCGWLTADSRFADDRGRRCRLRLANGAGARVAEGAAQQVQQPGEEAGSRIKRMDRCVQPSARRAAAAQHLNREVVEAVLIGRGRLV
jgi:hypothetical protein